jgi:hypothetical protein
MTMNPKWIRERHEHWCNVLAAFADEHGHATTRPKCEVVLNAAKWAGRYRTKNNTCYYSLPYAMVEGAHYDETIAHECCHSYQRFFAVDHNGKTKWHGDFFLFLLRYVCGFKKAGFYHTTSVAKVKKVAKLLKLAVSAK